MLIRLPELPRVFELYKGRMTSYVLRKCAWCEIARKIDSLSLSPVGVLFSNVIRHTFLQSLRCHNAL